MKLWRYLVAGALLVVGRGRHRELDRRPRLIPLEGPPTKPWETVVVVLLWLSALSFLAFPPVYVVTANTQLLGLTMGLGFVFLGTALATAGKTLVPQEESVEERQPLEHPATDVEIAQMIHEGGDRISRGKLVFGALGAAGLGLVAAVLTSLDSLGPFLGTERLQQSPWYRGRRVVDEDGHPIKADDVTVGSFLMAFPEGAPDDTVGAPINLIRLPESSIKVRPGWAPEGIMAFSRICTHAGCAVSMYRWPLFGPKTPKGPAFVCPCHYSTFDPREGGKVIWGPAGRALPQLPLEIGPDRVLRAAGTYDENPGPSWWGVRYKGKQA